MTESRRRFTLAIAATVLGVAGGILIAEGAARILQPDGPPELRLPAAHFEHPRDLPAIPYLLRANAPGWTNSLGLRNSREISPRKRAGVFRLLVVGDSVTALSTDGIAPDGLYPSMLEGLLEKRLDQPVEVLNLSSPGLSMEQELTLLKGRGLSLEPDLVLLAYSQNDPVRTDIATAANVDVVNNLRLVQLLQLWLARRQSVGTKEDWYQSGSAVFAQLDRSFAELARLAAERRIVLVPLPVRRLAAAEQIHLDAVARLCRRHGLECLDIYATMLPYLSGLDQEPHDTLHFETAGHRAVAEALAVSLSDLIRRSIDAHAENR